MFFLKVATIFLVAHAVGAEKKIELQDIEEDNLKSEMKSEKDKELDKFDSPPSSGPGFNSMDFFKSSGLLRYFDNSQSAPQVAPQHQRYVHQYAVTEQPERAAPAAINNRGQYAPPAPSAAQQAMVGYLSNIPMQIYLVPQYYSEQSDQSNHLHASHQYQSPGVPVAAYQTAPDAVQTQNNYIEVPANVPLTGKTYVQQYTPPQSVTYGTYPSQPTAITPHPAVLYQVPIVQYNPAPAVPTSGTKAYYPNPEYTDTNTVDDIISDQKDQKQYSTPHTQTEHLYHFAPAAEFPRLYNSRAPIREEYRDHVITELPRPNPLLLKGSASHISHLPKSLPMYRPLTKPVYQVGAPNFFTPRPYDNYGFPPFKRRPASLLDSYIPSSLQVEYLKRGLVKEPLAAYDALASGRLPHPRQFERGFLPNQMYHTGAGGVTYGHYKRAPKVPQK